MPNCAKHSAKAKRLQNKTGYLKNISFNEVRIIVLQFFR